MKKLLFIAPMALVAMFFSNCGTDETKDSGAPFMASTEVENKHAVLEDFTGVRCGYCPQGHIIAADLAATHGENFMVIAVNAGGYAAPAPGWADFTTSYGDALIAQSAVAGYPAGTVNRIQYGQGQKGGLAMSRGSWSAASNEIMSQESPVNIGAKATFDEATRELTVMVDLYYTADGNGANKINVALLQSGMIAKQSGGTSDYEHKHVLRDMVTGQWGEEVPSTSTTPESKFSATYTYFVPENFNGADIPPGGGVADINNMNLVVFVAEGNENIYTGIEVAID
jgi:hypothetical protein